MAAKLRAFVFWRTPGESCSLWSCAHWSSSFLLNLIQPPPQLFSPLFFSFAQIQIAQSYRCYRSIYPNTFPGAHILYFILIHLFKAYLVFSYEAHFALLSVLHMHCYLTNFLHDLLLPLILCDLKLMFFIISSVVDRLETTTIGN